MNEPQSLSSLDPSLPKTIAESQKLFDEIELFLNSETYLAYQRYFKETAKTGTENVVGVIPFSIGDFLLREQAIGVLAKSPEYLGWFEQRRQNILDHIEALSALQKVEIQDQ